MSEEKKITYENVAVRPDVYIAALLDEVNEHLLEVKEILEKKDPTDKKEVLPTRFYNTDEQAILVDTPDRPDVDVIADPTTSTPGYQAHRIYETLKRRSPRISVINDGTDTIYVISTSDGSSWTEENPVLQGESRTFYNVYELRLRSPTHGDTSVYTGGVYRVTEYDFKLAYSGLQPSVSAVLGFSTLGTGNLTTVMAFILGLPMNAATDTTVPLGAGATYFGQTRDFRFSRLGFMGAIAYPNVGSGSAANGFRIQQSIDAVNWDFDGDAVTVAGGTGARVKSAIASRFARVAYTNGGLPQVNFRLGSRAMIS